MAMGVQDKSYSDRIGASNYDRFPTSEISAIVAQIEMETADNGISQSIHFTTGVLNRIERQLTLGCSIIADTRLILPALDRAACEKLPVRLECHIDNPQVVSFATQKRVTRAEVAAERALSTPGSKIMVVGSAPMALNRILQMHRLSPLVETTVIAAANGFANVVELKERLWESGLPCVVIRGRNGGAPAAIAITNVLLRDAADKL